MQQGRQEQTYVHFLGQDIRQQAEKNVLSNGAWSTLCVRLFFHSTIEDGPLAAEGLAPSIVCQTGRVRPGRADIYAYVWVKGMAR